MQNIITPEAKILDSYGNEIEAGIPQEYRAWPESYQTVEKVLIKDLDEKNVKSAKVVKTIPKEQTLVVKVGSKINEFKHNNVYIVNDEVFVVCGKNPRYKLAALMFVAPSHFFRTFIDEYDSKHREAKKLADSMIKKNVLNVDLDSQINDLVV